MGDDFVKNLFGFMGLGVMVVLVGVLLKDAGSVNTIMSGFSQSYGSILGQLQKSG